MRFKLKERYKILIGIILFAMIILFAGRRIMSWWIIKDLTPEEKVIYYEQKQEAKQGYKLLTSHQLTEQEQELVSFLKAAREEDTKTLCTMMDVPDTFSADTLQEWLHTTGLSSLLNYDNEALGVLSREETATYQIDRYNSEERQEIAYYLFVDENKDLIVRFVYSINKAGDVFTPDQGIVENYMLLAPSKGLFPASVEAPSANPDAGLNKYITTSVTGPYVTSEKWGSTWFEYDFPRFLNISEPAFVIHTMIGDFPSYFMISNDRYSYNTVIIDPAAEQVETLVKETEDTIATIFRKVQGNASLSTLAKYISSQEIATTLVGPEEGEDPNDRAFATYNSIIDKINSVGDVSIELSDQAEGAMPEIYNCRLEGEDGVILKVNAKLETTEGECRKTTFLYMRFLDDRWKLVNMDGSNNNNLFWNISAFNPQW